MTEYYEVTFGKIPYSYTSLKRHFYLLEDLESRRKLIKKYKSKRLAMLKKGLVKIVFFVIMSLLYSGAIWGGIILKKEEIK